MNRSRTNQFVNAAALLWGLAEAVVLFVVPDVLLTLVAQRRGIRAAIIATIFTVSGACLGGALMWRLGRDHPDGMIALLDWLPAIPPKMIADAGPVLSREPFHALLDGAFSGVPYKVFAALSANAGIPLAPFLLITIPARAARFLAATAATVLVDRLLARWVEKRTRTLILAGFWVLFYLIYWAVMPS